jgi:hypothetical protein
VTFSPAELVFLLFRIVGITNAARNDPNDLLLAIQNFDKALELYQVTWMAERLEEILSPSDLVAALRIWDEINDEAICAVLTSLKKRCRNFLDLDP